MAEEVRLAEENSEPAGELIHLPGPSFLPVLAALGITLVVVGVVVSLIMVVIGAVIAAVAIVRWIAESRREMAELPLEHH